MITQACLKELLRYEPETGQLYWLVNRRRARAGASAGTVDGNGYLHMSVLGKFYKAHRLVWLLTYGEWPAGLIDHINGDKLDNRLANLRVVTHRQNQQNRERHRAGRLVGCYYNKRAKRWQAYIKAQGERRHLGMYDTEQEAHAAYLHALTQLKEQ